MSDPRQRVLDAAVRCFATKGFEATRIADIEEAAGLSPGAGGTYRHFPSKVSMIEAAVDDALRENREDLAPVPTSIVDAARSSLDLMSHNLDLLKVLLRDLDRFPELFERVCRELLDHSFEIAAERTAVIAPAEDYEALAAVAGAAMFGFTVHRAFVGRTPLDVDDERFAVAWAHLLNLLVAETLASPDADTTSEGDT